MVCRKRGATLRLRYAATGTVQAKLTLTRRTRSRIPWKGTLHRGARTLTTRISRTLPTSLIGKGTLTLDTTNPVGKATATITIQR